MKVDIVKNGNEYIYLITNNNQRYYLDLHNAKSFDKLKKQLKQKGVKPFKIKGLISYV